MTETPEFDWSAGAEAQDEGIDRAVTEDKSKMLFKAQAIAFVLALRYGEVTADMVRERYNPPLGPAWGALFRGGKWEHTGKFRCSEIVSNHRRPQRVWRLK